MKVYICTGFEGHWPVGTAAVVIAKDNVDAAILLNEKLKMPHGLKGGVEPGDMTKINSSKECAFVLCDGNY